MDINWSLVVSIYAAIIATFVAVWRIIEFFYDRKGKIKIHIINVGFPLTEYYEEDTDSKVITFITNIGSKSRHIKSPYYQFWRKWY